MSDTSSAGPSPAVGSSPVSRRAFLGGGMATLGALAVPGLAACGSGSGGGGGGKPAAKTITFGSNGSDAVPKKAYQAVFDLYQQKTGIKVKVNTVDHNTFQEQINNYLQGRPDPVFTWFAGNRR